MKLKNNRLRFLGIALAAIFAIAVGAEILSRSLALTQESANTIRAAAGLMFVIVVAVLDPE